MQSVNQVSHAAGRFFGGMQDHRVNVRVASELRPLIPRFLANRRTEIESLEQALERGDAETLRRIGHCLKGVGGGYGFDEITRIGAKIEQHAKSGDGNSARSFVLALKRYLEDVEVCFE